jgi:hypothetical protein
MSETLSEAVTRATKLLDYDSNYRVSIAKLTGAFVVFVDHPARSSRNEAIAVFATIRSF